MAPNSAAIPLRFCAISLGPKCNVRRPASDGLRAGLDAVERFVTVTVVVLVGMQLEMLVDNIMLPRAFDGR